MARNLCAPKLGLERAGCESEYDDGRASRDRRVPVVGILGGDCDFLVR